MTKIKALLFDKDGTLINFEGSWGVGMTRLLERIYPDNTDTQKAVGVACGFDVEQKKFMGGSVFVNGTTDQMLNVWKETDPTIDKEYIVTTAQECFADLEPMPVCDLPALLNKFKAQGYLLAVITNATEESTFVQLQKLGILDLFDRVIGCDSGYTPKPAPDTILGFCKEFGISPKDTAMIGDSTHDLRAGRAAKVGLNIAVLSGPAPKEQLQDHADVILNDITEISAQLL